MFAEALAGVISWSIPAWLSRSTAPSWRPTSAGDGTDPGALHQNGLAELSQNMIEVLRWGLWMSPIINSFLRPMGEPTWYNQDGAVRT